MSFEEKLKKYLESILVSDEMAKRIRAAFDAYIFLSYRKKDRKYANQLMRIIHSKLFTLLVTPNLLEERDGWNSLRPLQKPG